MRPWHRRPRGNALSAIAYPPIGSWSQRLTRSFLPAPLSSPARCMIPLCFILPILMWTVYNKDVASTRRKAVNWALIATFSLLSVVATVGSGGPAARGPAAFSGCGASAAAAGHGISQQDAPGRTSDPSAPARPPCSLQDHRQCQHLPDLRLTAAPLAPLGSTGSGCHSSCPWWLVTEAKRATAYPA